MARIFALPVLFLALSALVVTAEAAGTDPPLTLSDLATQRELWPTEVTILREAKFQNGRSVGKGQVVVLDQVTPQGLRLDDGAMFFMYPADDTDLMQRVAGLVDSLTPQQRALTMDDVRRNDELWPMRATLRWAMTLDDGTRLEAGKELVVLGFLPDGRVRLADMEQNASVPVDPWESDLFVRARERVALDNEVPFSWRLLESMLEPSTDGSTVSDYDYVVMYDGRDSCTRSVAFAPELAKFQESSASAGATWLLILVNAAGTPQMNHAHYRNMGLQGRTAKDGWGPALHEYFELGGYETPWVHVFDRAGNEIATASAAASSSSDVLDLLAERVRSAGD